MINPWYTYVFSFSLVLFCYSLGWSELYPSLTWNLLLFLLTTFIVSVVIGCRHRTSFIFKDINYDKNLYRITVYLYFLWITQFIYAKGIPLVKVIRGEYYDYTQFGIPTLHVFIVTFSSFFTVYLFHVYICNKKSNLLIIYLLNLLPPILIVNRGMFLINLVSCLFVYLIYYSNKNIEFIKIAKKGVSILLILFLILFGFGAIGNLRTASQLADKNSNLENFILDVGEASPGFINSPIPKEFFWAYLYISSPLANLQTNINDDKYLDLDLTNFIMFINTQLLPDFISKRINTIYDADTKQPILMVNALTVSSVYAASYVYLSWLGVVIMSIFIIIFPLFYISFLSKKSKYYVTAIAILNSLYLFLIFDNMFSFSGLSLQLLYPLIFHKLDKMKLIGR
ncbi:O-antigen polysaccharide polymerase Wzy [Dolichospermum compactum]|uniref:Oligosaccharide repeat unit polymerase n=1 Tax=Dolichospermum compactum NIES-806 TaxID=1973481 RepID=A0A1Z4V062_9CYAN|nr:O-antigen polysaccharide polymerase Wzy [Dolichospermum compactum]BAZ84813.1 hypothetical protein NIES806_10060 [Dolichospermum compactum NIES-806]